MYQKILSNTKKDLEANQQSFLEKSLYEQVLLLLEILKPFRCNAQYANLSALNGKGTVGRVLIQKKLNNAMSASLIHQSVTGLYECREDLLK